MASLSAEQITPTVTLHSSPSATIEPAVNFYELSGQSARNRTLHQLGRQLEYQPVEASKELEPCLFSCGETIVIGDNIRVTVTSIGESQVQIGIEAPAELHSQGNPNGLMPRYPRELSAHSYKDGGRVGRRRASDRLIYRDSRSAQ